MAATNLTFGIELEIICIRPDELFVFEGLEEDHHAAAIALYNALNASGIPAVGYEDPDVEYVGEPPTYSRWRVDYDCLRLSPGEKRRIPHGWTFEPIELSSRILHFFTDDWHSEIQAVLGVLRKLEMHGCRFIANKTTGFHVHVGRDGGKLPLATCKNVFQIGTAFERLFDELHAVSRIPPPDCDPSFMYYPPSFLFTQGSMYRAQRHVFSNLFERLAAIEAVKTYRELGRFSRFHVEEQILYVDGHSCAYNFDNLFVAESDEECERQEGREDEASLKGTIEFRQHTGTLDWYTIAAWVTTVCSLVKFAGETGPDDLVDLCVRGADVGFGLDQLLQALNVDNGIVDFYLQRNEEPEEIGILGNGVPPHHQPVDDVIGQNDIECTERSNFGEVMRLIDGKYQAKLYGIDSKNTYSIARGNGKAVFDHMRKTIIQNSRGPETSADLQNAIVSTYSHFAASYPEAKQSS